MACACSSTSPDGSLEPPRDEAGRPLLAELTARPDAPQVAAGERGLRKHVWQCSLSLPADDRGPGDAEWRQIAERFIEGMGFAGDPERAGLRWVAVHHGLSSTGNDHIHLAVTLTEDGAPVSRSTPPVTWPAPLSRSWLSVSAVRLFATSKPRARRVLRSTPGVGLTPRSGGRPRAQRGGHTPQWTMSLVHGALPLPGITSTRGLLKRASTWLNASPRGA